MLRRKTSVLFFLLLAHQEVRGKIFEDSNYFPTRQGRIRITQRSGRSEIAKRPGGRSAELPKTGFDAPATFNSLLLSSSTTARESK